ncbi:MAG: rhomboid family intramembrane serine protease, partial [Candidatus Faecousia sp.]|nr:rhomboid family intramembrane serine protease [Candidatus Faecousia sp.]
MKNLRRSFERFCLRNQNKGIRNLMLYICSGNAVVYLLSLISQNYYLYDLLCFDRTLILRGQVWRLVTYPLTMHAGMTGGLSILLVAISLLCYYSLGMVIERRWGTLKFNLFYLSGVVMMDVFCMFFPNCRADVSYLNLSLFLSYATMFPDATFLLYMIIPIKAWIFALIDLVLVLLGIFQNSFPTNFFPLIALANYFLFFGSDVLNLLPVKWQFKLRSLFRKKSAPQGPKVVHFRVSPQQEQKKQDYNHRCTVCGRTDVTNPELEFRYCSRCKGYYCYCQDHI